MSKDNRYVMVYKEMMMITKTQFYIIFAYQQRRKIEENEEKIVDDIQVVETRNWSFQINS